MGVVVEETLKVKVGSADSASLVHLELFFYLTLGITHFPWHIDISCSKHIKINQAIEGALANHERIFVVGTDMIQRLPLFDERRNDGVEVLHLVLRKREALSGFGKKRLVFVMSWYSMVEAFLQSALIQLNAAVADIGRFVMSWTELALKGWANSIA